MLIYIFLAGVAIWTLTEYFLHRFLGHVHKGKNFFKKEHLMHHSKANYFAPAYKKATLALGVSVLLCMLLSLLTSFGTAISFIAGFAGMYTLYEITHYRFHSKVPIAGPFIVLRKHHFFHHFHNPRVNHGVTTRFWDRVFGTFHRVEKVTVPKQMSMSWLISGQEIKDIYKPHFRLGRL